MYNSKIPHGIANDHQLDQDYSSDSCVLKSIGIDHNIYYCDNLNRFLKCEQLTVYGPSMFLNVGSNPCRLYVRLQQSFDLFSQ